MPAASLGCGRFCLEFDPAAQALHSAALKQAGWYKRVDGREPSEGKLPNPDVNYPTLKRAAAFVCTARQCSLPIFAADGIAQFLAERAERAGWMAKWNGPGGMGAPLSTVRRDLKPPKTRFLPLVATTSSVATT